VIRASVAGRGELASAWPGAGEALPCSGAGGAECQDGSRPRNHMAQPLARRLDKGIALTIGGRTVIMTHPCELANERSPRWEAARAWRVRRQSPQRQACQRRA
jgi:hypothetical protein